MFITIHLLQDEVILFVADLDLIICTVYAMFHYKKL